ncbi:MAG: hypothetical protein JW893_04250 [Candidatus Omnitrophica bacterium]|nr:hypothetical protein [Candidatus Omnitrophota bacterium]
MKGGPLANQDSFYFADDKIRSSPGGSAPQGGVLALLADMGMATRLVQAAKNLHLPVKILDEAETLLTCAEQTRPGLIILDWDAKEQEAYKLVKAMADRETLRRIPTVGFVSQGKSALKEEAQRAGCDRVLGKTEFIRTLHDILMRHGK